jgi:hypothetical protein
MASVYLESTIPSYLVAGPSRDLIAAAHQQLTHEWWTTAADGFDLYVSEAVLDEVRAGDRKYANDRLRIVAGLPILAFSDDVESLIRTYHRRLGLVGSATADLPHFAYAVAYKMDYLLTWNCAHIANGQVIRRLLAVDAEIGRETPIIVTPEELLTTYPGDVR